MTTSDTLHEPAYDVPTRVVFGEGTVERAGELVREHGSRALVVTGRTAARRHGHLDRVLASLAAAGVGATVYDRVSANPRSDEVDEAAALARADGTDVVVGLGGGSALDAAKAVAVAVALEGSVREVIGVTLDPAAPVLPLVAVPTTAGSGSEVTKGAIVTDTVRRFRSGIRGEALFPRVAVVDPGLLASVPPEVLAETAFDAFAHAVEGSVAVAATPASRDLARQAIGLITAHLPAALAGATDPAHRSALARAALLGGVNVATASTCLPHRLQQAMGSLPGLGISHGRGLAVLYPAWLRHTESLAPEPFGELADVLGTDSVHEGVERLREAAGLTARLRDWGVTEADLDTLVAGVSGNLGNDPAGATADPAYLRTLYAEAL
ncbi:iron-containing alcohol dehydrogenase [Streptomyces arenae]|uniref:iron-containing alcohol dehydrogenase n=1 Tax=Streptomyces arenae TaxID=29301 RepID=UPI00265A985A|nr:iron-containing alcohol dehydrogenase [Streptomyces arenae]MCG7206614.1 iron-containing alcohol dehydrogenase [Streptomyces arenae]